MCQRYNLGHSQTSKEIGLEIGMERGSGKGLKRKLDSNGDLENRAGWGGRGGDGGRGRGRGAGRGGRVGRGGRGRGRSSGDARVQGERTMDRQLGVEDETPPESLHKYVRGPGNDTSWVQDKKLRGKLRRTEEKFEDAAYSAAAAEILLPQEAGYLEAEGMEKTFKFTQAQLKGAVDLNTAREIFDLDLPDLGPYAIDYTRNGRFMVLGGRKGHLALLDALRMDVQMEVQLGDTIRDVKALHNENLVAVAQKKYVYIYDSQGAEVHCLRTHLEPRRLEFLPYHFLLASIGRTGFLKYTDISTGQQVAEFGSKLGSCDSLRSNPYNAILHAGHRNGVVTMWTPAMAKPVIRMLTHSGPVTALAVDPTGRYMVTSGMDAQAFVLCGDTAAEEYPHSPDDNRNRGWYARNAGYKTKVWDIRTYKEVHAYLTRNPPTDMDISQRGLLSLAYGCHVQVWKDAISTKAKRPYMEHDLPTKLVHRTRFRPLQDVLGIGHSEGYSSMVVPGAGEPNFDTFEANPFQSSKQRREAEVQSLLDKLPLETIGLDPSFVGRVDKDPAALLEEQRELFEAANSGKGGEKKEKKKTRGRSKVAKKLQKKQKNVVDAGIKKLRDKLEGERAKEKEKAEEKRVNAQAAEAPLALRRFFKK